MSHLDAVADPDRLARSFSLIVTMEVVKFQQAGFINYDLGEQAVRGRRH